MTVYLCALCGSTTESVGLIGGTPFCYTPNKPCCYAEASVRREITALKLAAETD